MRSAPSVTLTHAYDFVRTVRSEPEAQGSAARHDRFPQAAHGRVAAVRTRSLVDAISIATAGPWDLQSAVGLLQAQFHEHGISTPEEALRDVVRLVIDDPRHRFMLLASSAHGPFAIAYAAAHLSAEHGGLIGWLEELYVKPDQRGNGVGSSLLVEVTARAEQLGWRGVELEVVEGHERAAALYLRHGFRPVARSRYSRIFR